MDIVETGMMGLLKKRIRDLMNDKADVIAGGAASDFAEYKNWCGVIEGLALAERELLDIIDFSQEED